MTDDLSCSLIRRSRARAKPRCAGDAVKLAGLVIGSLKVIGKESSFSK